MAHTRTDTTHLTSFTRPAPSAVTYTLPAHSTAPPSTIPPKPSTTPPPTSITINLPPNSTWTSGLHWHETHTEYLLILSGTAQITLGTQTANFTTAHGPITVPRYALHSWQRAVPDDGETLIVKEWTDPADGEKEVFFRNLNSVILEEMKREGGVRGWWLELELWNLFWRVDNWPVVYAFGWLPRGPAWWLEWAVTHLVLGMAVLVGKVLGIKGVYKEYTLRRKE